MTIEFEQIIKNLNEKWTYLITTEIKGDECVITFPFIKRNNENVKVYLSKKGNYINVSVTLNNPPKLTDSIAHGNYCFSKDSEVSSLYTMTNSVININNVIIAAVSLALIFS